MRNVFLLLSFVLQSLPADADPVIKGFPYPLITVSGSEAFEEWQKLRPQKGTPIILGAREEVERIADAFDPSWDPYYDSIAVSLAKADTYNHPTSLFDHRTSEHRSFIESLRDSGSDWADEMAESDPLAIPQEYWGPWPSESLHEDRLISLDDWQTGRLHDTVYITILPTENAWQAPSYLRFGGWNANPPPDIHAAAFRKWAEDYGAVPVVIQSDIVEFYVASPPEGRKAAKALAREQYLYCNDIVDQGVGDMSVLAAILEQGHFWYFWWD